MKKIVLLLVLTVFLLSTTAFAATGGQNAEVLENGTKFTNNEIKYIVNYHVSNYLQNKIMDTKITVSDEWVPLYDTHNNLIAYAVGLVDNNGRTLGHINIGALTDGYSFYAIEETPDTYNAIKKFYEMDKQIVFIPPASFLIKDNDKTSGKDKYYKITGEEYSFDKIKTKNTNVDKAEKSVSLDEIYKNIRKESNKKDNDAILKNADTTFQVTVTAEDVRLSDYTYFVKIMDGTTRYYGGNQAWFPTTTLQNTGCGPTAAANITAYMSMKKSWASNLYKYNKTNITKTDFTNHMNEVIQYVSPNPLLGMPSYTEWGSDVEAFAASRGVALWPYYSSDSPTLDNASNYVKNGLTSDAPVGVLMYYNPYLSEYDWHWMTITRYSRDTLDNRYINVSSWGNMYSLNWKWVWENSLYGAILYFY